MAGKFDIGKYAATLGQTAPAERTRDIEAVTAEIIQLKQDAGNAIIGIGQRLIEAKAMLPHGAWLPWLEDRVEFSERTARNFMRLAREWTNRQALADLGAAKALTLLALPPEERETFMAENNVVDMTSRELEKAIRERDEARQAAEAAQAELQALRDKPVEVAVETVVDEEAIAKARADAIAEMRTKVDAAEGARKEAEKKRKDAEKALAEAKKQAGANAQILSRAERAERELAEARRALEAAEKAEKTAAVNADPDLAMFNVIFNQTQEQVNKMHGLRMKIGKNDEALDGKLKAAIHALADAVRRCAE